MRLRARGGISLLAFLAGVGACDDPTAPATTDLTLTFCFTPPSWVAMKNEGEPWRTIATTPMPHSVTVAATDRVSLAVFGNGALDFYFVTRAQLETRFPSCTAPGTGTVTGSFANMPTTVAEVAIGRHLLLTPGPGYTISALEGGEHDLVGLSGSSMIIRRAQTLDDGAVIPALDFASAEAFATQTVSITTTGAPTAPTLFSYLYTQRGTLAMLQPISGPCCEDGRIATVPAAHIAAGDIQMIAAVTTLSGDIRNAYWYFTAPADRTIALGPAAATPVVKAFGEHEVLWTLSVPWQPEYDAQIQFDVFSPAASPIYSRTTVYATREFFGGTPATWSLIIPNFAGMRGFDGPQITNPSQWIYQAASQPWEFTSSMAKDGDVFRAALTTP